MEPLSPQRLAWSWHGNLVNQMTSRSLTHPGKILWTNWSENKASFISLEKRKESR